MKSTMVAACLLAFQLASAASAVHWPKPVAPVIPQADGYVAIPQAAVMPQRSRVYHAVFNATLPASQPDQIVPALNMAGSELNLLAGAGLSVKNARFVVVFHGGALDAVLDDAHYRAKHRVANPNLPVISALRKAGVELFVCGQNLAFENVDPGAVSADVKIALDALVVLMAYQNDGYALMSF
jgi:intracellular sulfur oxidation DsrE/DsrF family protein